MSYTEQIDFSRIPQHVAIIMDGNGRWAKQRGRERSFGHQTGAETVHVIAEEAARMGIKYLTLYTKKSTENGEKIIFNDGFFFHCVINRRAVAGDNIAQKGQCLDCLWHCAEGSACGRHKINALFVHLFQRMI